MKYVICSDVHANFEAFQAVLSFAQANSPDQIFHLGDIVGYCADPEGCMDLIDEHNIVNLAGNHDHAVAGLMNIDYFNFYAKESILWTRRQLSDQKLQILRSLPMSHTLDRIMMVHAAPDQPESWNYIFNVHEAMDSFAYMDHLEIDICFIGHSHQPIIFEKPSHGPVTHLETQEIQLVSGHKYIINVGSVGQPRDGSPHACVAIFDTKYSMYHLYRVPYPVKSTQEKMIAADIDPFLIQRIAYGR